MALELTKTQETFLGFGELVVGGLRAPISNFSLTLPINDPTLPCTFLAQVNPEPFRDLVRLIREGNSVTLLAQIGFEKSLRVPELKITDFRGTTSAGIIEGTASEIYLGLEVLPFSPTAIHLAAKLSANKVTPEPFDVWALYENGQIFGSHPRARQVIDSPIGCIAISQEYEYAGAMLNGQKVDVRIPHTLCSLNCSNLLLDVNMHLQAYAKELDLLSALIGFLSRQQVTWVNVRMSAVGESPAQRLDHQSPELHRYSIPSGASNFLHPLIEWRRLPPDGFHRMVERMREERHRGELETVISHLWAVSGDGPLVHRVVSAFTAMETLINAIGQEQAAGFSITNANFHRLSKQLVTVIEKFAADRDLDAFSVQAIIKKLPELKRRPIIDRTAALVEVSEVEWEDLWPHGTLLTDALKGAYSRRNNLIHQGSIEATPVLRVDMLRIHALTERLLFRLLGGEREWLSTHAFAHVDQLAESSP